MATYYKLECMYNKQRIAIKKTKTEKEQIGTSFSIYKNVLDYIIKDLIIQIKVKIFKITSL